MSPMNTVRLRARREATRDEIRHAAWQQIAKQGAPALSLRAIAQHMGLTAPALYRYFGSRDDLVTALIVEAYRSLGDCLDSARQAVAESDHAGRFLAAGLSYREWALTHPEHFALIFGTPIPGYAAPREQTLPAAARALGVLMEVLQAAWESGAIRTRPSLGESLLAQLEAWRMENALQAPAPVLYMTLISWGRVHGLTSLELHGHFPPQIESPGEIFLREILALRDQIGLG